jgi:hypothetical protein
MRIITTEALLKVSIRFVLLDSRSATKTGDSIYVRELIKQMNRILQEQKDLIF